MVSNTLPFDDVCRRFDLGMLRTAPVEVSGGLSTRLYRDVTDRGEFAVKRMIASAGVPEIKREVEAAFAVELMAQAAGIAMPEPIPVAGSHEALARIADGDDSCWVRVHRWVEGTPVGPGSIEPGDRAEVGVILAALHGLPPIEESSTLPVAAPAAPYRDWSSALDVHRSESALPQAVSALEAIVRQGHDHLRPRTVISHRDLDPRNLLRDVRGRLIVLDWDAAGSTDAQWDAVGVAFDWSGIWQGVVSPRAFADVLGAYTAAGRRLEPITAGSFAGWADGVLGRLWFNLERTGSPDERERRLGQAEISRITRLLPVAADWITAIDDNS